MAYQLEDFDFTLPPELIAQTPLSQRSNSRLLHVAGKELYDRHFYDLLDLLQPGDLLVGNDTKVIKARFFGHKLSGGRVEVLLERILDPQNVLVQIRANRPVEVGRRLIFAGSMEAEIVARQDKFFHLFLYDNINLMEWLEQYGSVPLPSYITRSPDQEDELLYQTVFAREAGAVAAPTASLHFDRTLLEQLQAQGIRFATLTLHVGAGTFTPVRSNDIAEHIMHSERYSIPESTVLAVAETRRQGRQIIAIGSTSLRTLETAALPDGTLRAGSGTTDLFITPGYSFKVVDRLITNFHLPKSTLLILVSAFAGYQKIRAAYDHAIKQAYRFYSYGDAMLLERAP